MKKYILLLFSISCFAQFNPAQWYSYGSNVSGYNTFIGGIGGTINTKELLAAKIGVSAGAIKNFSVVGSEVRFRISINYGSSGTWFTGETSSNRNPGITYYKDIDNKVTSLKIGAFYSNQQQMLITRIYFKNVSQIGDYCFLGDGQRSYIQYIDLPNCTSALVGQHFKNLPDLKKVNIPLLTSLGSSALDNNCFFNIPATAKIYANTSLQTSNAGAEEGDIAYARGRGATIVYVLNQTPPNPITNLSIGTVTSTSIQVNFTAPTGSTNAIDFYEVWLNGFPYQEISGSGQTITGLTTGTSYEIEVKPVDIYYNKSSSNKITQSTL